MGVNNLRKIREERGVLQKDVALALGISRATYSNYESGQRSPDPEMLKALASFFAVTIDELLDYAPQDTGRLILRFDERMLLKKYRSLSTMGQERTLKQLDFEMKMESAFCERKKLVASQETADNSTG